MTLKFWQAKCKQSETWLLEVQFRDLDVQVISKAGIRRERVQEIRRLSLI